jgi:hypothetical protein
MRYLPLDKRRLPPIRKDKLAKVKKKLWRQKARKATGELEMFSTIWQTRPHVCAECRAEIKEAAPWCFSHKLPKSTFPEYRLVQANISLVCSIKCHAAVDRQRKEMTAEWVEENERWLQEHPEDA